MATPYPALLVLPGIEIARLWEDPKTNRPQILVVFLAFVAAALNLAASILVPLIVVAARYSPQTRDVALTQCLLAASGIGALFPQSAAGYAALSFLVVAFGVTYAIPNGKLR